MSVRWRVGCFQSEDSSIINSKGREFDMKEKWKHFCNWAAAIWICILALGVLTLIWPEISAVMVCCILGVLCIGIGIYKIVRYFALGFAGLFFRHDLATGIFSVLAGILLLLHPMGAASFLPIITGIYMILGSVFDIQISIETQKLGIGNWKFSLALGIVSTVFALFLILNPFDGVKALMIYIGVLLIVESIQNLSILHGISKVVKASRRDDIIDVQWESVE